jgi:hypothetical protein
MGKSSIHLQTAKGGSIIHNSRENYSKSVVFTDEKNELWNDSKTAFKMFRDELEIRSNAYTTRTKQKLQKNTSTMLSAVTNLEQHHTLKDLEKIKDYLEKEFDTKVIQMAIHRDEGKLVKKDDESIKLVSGIDFFLNEKNNKLYFDNKFEKEINMNEWNIEKNYHGHFEMLGIDSLGKSIRTKMNIYKLSQMQDFTAKVLGMERTKSNVQTVEKNGVKKVERISTNNKKRLDTNEFKEAKKIENETVKKTKSNTKEDLEKLKSETKELREQLKEYKAIREDYKKLDDLNKSLQEQLKAKEIDLETALKEVSNLKKSYTILESNYETSKNNNVSLISKNATLSIENKKLEKEDLSNKSLISTLTKETVTLQNQVNTLKSENKSLQEENKQKPIQTIQNNQIEVLSYSKAESDLSQDFYSMIEKREFKTGLMSKEDFTVIKKQEVGTPTILEVIKSHFKKVYNALHEKIKSLTVENINLKKANLDLKIENLKLTNEINKNKSLSLTGEKKETALEMKARQLDVKEILQGSKKEKDQEEVKEKKEETTNTKRQNYGYELR